MKWYRLPYVMHSPSEETEDKYLAEIPSIPGCRAWGDTPDDARDNLQNVASSFVASYRELGDELPSAVSAALVGQL